MTAPPSLPTDAYERSPSRRSYRRREDPRVRAYTVLRVVPAQYRAQIGRCALTWAHREARGKWPEVAANGRFCRQFDLKVQLKCKFIPARVAVGANFWAKGPKMRAIRPLLGFLGQKLSFAYLIYY